MNNRESPTAGWILSISTEDQHREIDLICGTTYILGRGLDADIYLDDQRASRRHARLCHVEGHWRIEDLGSTNGIHAKGKRVDRAIFQSETEVGIGDTKLAVFRTNSAGQTPLSAGSGTGRVWLWIMVLVCCIGLASAFYIFLPQTGSPPVTPSPGIEVADQPPAPLENVAGLTSLRTPSMEYYRQGLTLYETDHLRDAIDKWDMALALDRDNRFIRQKLKIALEELNDLVDRHYNRGITDMRYMRYYEARQHFQIVMELTRNQQDGRYNNALKYLQEIEGYE